MEKISVACGCAFLLGGCLVGSGGGGGEDDIKSLYRKSVDLAPVPEGIAYEAVAIREDAVSGAH